MMKKPLTSLMALAFVGLIFFPDTTRGLARNVVGTVGDVAADATASAFVAVNDRITEEDTGAIPAKTYDWNIETPAKRCCPH